MSTVPTTDPRPSVEVHLTPDDVHRQLVVDVSAGLLASPKAIPPTWFYDDEGSRLFDEITRLPEYYPTRTERSILAANGAELAALAKSRTVVELGSGTSEKTGLILDAMADAGTLERFVPFDVSAATLRDAVERIAETRPGLAVHGVVGDFRHHLPQIGAATEGDGPRLVVFLGGTIGNLDPAERHRFLFDLDCQLTADDRLLLGTDLVKDRGRLVAAYDDSAGVTAAFNRNVLSVMNHELGTGFDPAGFEHVARFSEEHSRIEMWLRSTAAVDVDLGDLAGLVVGDQTLGATVHFDEGEELLTEISCKFTPEQVKDELWAAGFVQEAAWTDPAGDFLLTLSHPYC